MSQSDGDRPTNPGAVKRMRKGKPNGPFVWRTDSVGLIESTHPVAETKGLPEKIEIAEWSVVFRVTDRWIDSIVAKRPSRTFARGGNMFGVLDFESRESRAAFWKSVDVRHGTKFLPLHEAVDKYVFPSLDDAPKSTWVLLTDELEDGMADDSLSELDDFMAKLKLIPYPPSVFVKDS